MKIARSIGIFFLILLLLGWHHAWGQAEHTAKLIEGAKKEGEVIIYGTMALQDVNLLNARFREKYPFIDVKLNRLGSGNFVPRVLAEVRANKHLADVLQTNSLSLHYVKKEGLLTNSLSKAQSTPSSEGNDRYFYKRSSPFFSDLCGLGASLHEIFRVSVTALPRWVLRGEQN